MQLLLGGMSLLKSLMRRKDLLGCDIQRDNPLGGLGNAVMFLLLSSQHKAAAANGSTDNSTMAFPKQSHASQMDSCLSMQTAVAL